jgi:hypothetical protein
VGQANDWVFARTQPAAVAARTIRSLVAELTARAGRVDL